jgi:hypothetical protein
VKHFHPAAPRPPHSRNPSVPHDDLLPALAPADAHARSRPVFVRLLEVAIRWGVAIKSPNLSPRLALGAWERAAGLMSRVQRTDANVLLHNDTRPSVVRLR